VYQKMSFNNAPGAQSIGGFGIVHDGQDPSLFAFLSRSVFGVFANDSMVKNNLAAFVQCLDTGMAPAVGYARTLTTAGVNSTGTSNDWTVLEAQAVSGTNINLVIKGTIDGIGRGFVYQPASANYRPDTTNLTAMTRAELRAKVLAGDTLTVMGVPVGSGTRIGVDRDLNGILDGDEPAPMLRIALAAPNTIVAWPTNASGYVLERTSQLPATNWAADTSLRGLIGSDFTVTITNAPSPTNLFFRLRGL